MFKLSRRRFLQFLSSLAAFGVSIPALSSTRQPYVEQGEIVGFIGRSPGGFIGGRAVVKVLPWDGSGYPVELRNNSYGSYAGTDYFYDFDLADMRREVPDGFWHLDENRRRYNNVHTYIRTKRFGETAEQAVAHLNYR